MVKVLHCDPQTLRLVSAYKNLVLSLEEEEEGRRREGKEGREGERERGREGEREGQRKRRRQRGKEGGREGGKGGNEGMDVYMYYLTNQEAISTIHSITMQFPLT